MDAPEPPRHSNHLSTGQQRRNSGSFTCRAFPTNASGLWLQGAPAQTKVVADANFACRKKQVGSSGVRNCIDSTCELWMGEVPSGRAGLG